MKTPPFVGDLSARDAELLTTLGGNVLHGGRILEFGSGGSTQILAQASAPSVTIFSVDTDSSWIVRTRANLARLGVPATKVAFSLSGAYAWQDGGTFDLIFDDGFDDGTGDARLIFALQAWSYLRVGGAFALHDTRHHHLARILAVLVDRYFLEISQVFVNHLDSNLSIISKKHATPYVNWNQVEKREPWMWGGEPPPTDWPAKPRT